MEAQTRDGKPTPQPSSTTRLPLLASSKSNQSRMGMQGLQGACDVAACCRWTVGCCCCSMCRHFANQFAPAPQELAVHLHSIVADCHHGAPVLRNTGQIWLRFATVLRSRKQLLHPVAANIYVKPLYIFSLCKLDPVKPRASWTVAWPAEVTSKQRYLFVAFCLTNKGMRSLKKHMFTMSLRV